MSKRHRDDLGRRMKSQYEERSQTFLPRRTYTIIRLDGKGFSSYLKHVVKPFDENFSAIMDASVAVLMDNMQGAEFAYNQSDEVSILLTDFAKPQTNAWFDGNVQKIVSVSASILTQQFSDLMVKSVELGRPLMVERFPVFDARAFTIADSVEVENYFIYRQRDCIRNSIQAAAHNVFSHKELNGKNLVEIKAMLKEKGLDWDSIRDDFKLGRVVDAHEKGGAKFLMAKNWLENRDDLIARIPLLWEDDKVEEFLTNAKN